MKVKAVIFDLDGTVTEPFFDFDAIREEIGLPGDAGPILEEMEKMRPDERKRAESILHHREREAVEKSQLNPGTKETLEHLRQKGISIGVLTRNRRQNVEAIAAKHNLNFDGLVDREDGPVKPDSFGVKHLCREFGVKPEETLMVGDYLFDLLCARAAGAVSVLLQNRKDSNTFVEHADFNIENIPEILQIIKDKEQEG